MSNIVGEIVKARKEFRLKFNREPVKLRLGRLKAEELFLIQIQGYVPSFWAELFERGVSALKDKRFMGLRIKLSGDADSDTLEVL